MSPQRIMGIYVGYESPSIIKYLEPPIGDKLYFDELNFPTLGGDIKKLENKIS